MTSTDGKIDVNCPSCGKHYRLASASVGKAARCKCGNRFTVAASRRADPEVLAKPPPTPGSEQPKWRTEPCFKHPDQPSVHTCAKCHQPLCGACALRTKSGKHICRDCVPQKPQTSKPASPAPTEQIDTLPPQPTPTQAPDLGLGEMHLSPLPSAAQPTSPLTPVMGDEEVVEAIPIDEPAATTPLSTLQPLQQPAQPTDAGGIANFLGDELNTGFTAQPNQVLVNPYAQVPTQPLQQLPGSVATTQYVAGGERCAQHPDSVVSGRCSVCGKAVCRTCLFVFPPNMTCCPTCATETDFPISQHRKIMIYASMGCALFTTLFMALLCSGALSFLEGVPDLVFEILATAPACAGLGLACGSYNRSEGNPALLWAGAVWNGLALCAWFLFIVIIMVGMLG